MHLRTLWNLTRQNYTHELHRSYLEHFIDSKHNDQRNHHLTFCSNKLSRTPWKHQSEVDFLKCRISTRYIVIHHKSLKSASWLLVLVIVIIICNLLLFFVILNAEKAPVKPPRLKTLWFRMILSLWYHAPRCLSKEYCNSSYMASLWRCLWFHGLGIYFACYGKT